MALKDYYNILEVSSSATQDEIKKAYRRLSKIHHPDMNYGSAAAEEKFKEIQEAYEVLSDENRKWNYDVAYKNRHNPFYNNPAPQPAHTTYRPTPKYARSTGNKGSANLVRFFVFGSIILINLTRNCNSDSTPNYTVITSVTPEQGDSLMQKFFPSSTDLDEHKIANKIHGKETVKLRGTLTTHTGEFAFSIKLDSAYLYYSSPMEETVPDTVYNVFIPKAHQTDMLSDNINKHTSFTCTVSSILHNGQKIFTASELKKQTN